MIRTRRILALSLGAFLLLALATWSARAPLLRGLAHAWIVSDAPRKADAIVVLGGGIDTRPQIAARLYHQGIAPRVLVMQPYPIYRDEFHVLIDDIPKTQKLLADAGVPQSAIQLVEPKVGSTYDEAVALADWAGANGLHLLLVPTDMFHTRQIGRAHV